MLLTSYWQLQLLGSIFQSHTVPQLGECPANAHGLSTTVLSIAMMEHAGGICFVHNLDQAVTRRCKLQPTITYNTCHMFVRAVR